MQQCYSVASAQRRSRTAEGAMPAAPHEDGQQNVNIHLENGVPVYQDMSMNMQVKASMHWKFSLTLLSLPLVCVEAHCDVL